MAVVKNIDSIPSIFASLPFATPDVVNEMIVNDATVEKAMQAVSNREMAIEYNLLDDPTAQVNASMNEIPDADIFGIPSQAMFPGEGPMLEDDPFTMPYETGTLPGSRLAPGMGRPDVDFTTEDVYGLGQASPEMDAFWEKWDDPKKPATPEEIVSDMTDIGLTPQQIINEFNARGRELPGDLERFSASFVPGEDIPGIQSDFTRNVEAPDAVTEQRQPVSDDPASDDPATGLFPKEDVDAATEQSRYTETLQDAFYEAADKIPDVKRRDVRALLPVIYQDTEALFLLEAGKDLLSAYRTLFSGMTGAGELPKPGDKDTALKTVKARYETFLNQYLSNPSKYRSGDAIRNNTEKVRRILSLYEQDPTLEGFQWTPEDRADAAWVVSFFSEDNDAAGAKARRQRLINMYTTNGSMGWYSQQIHNTIQNIAEYHRLRGRSESKIMDFIIGRSPTQAPQRTDPSSIFDEVAPQMPGQTPVPGFTDPREKIVAPQGRDMPYGGQYMFPGGPGESQIMPSQAMLPSEVPMPDIGTSPYQLGSYVAGQEAQPGYSAAFEDPDWFPMDDPSSSFMDDFAYDPYATISSSFAGGPGSPLDWITQNQALANRIAGLDPNVQAVRAQGQAYPGMNADPEWIIKNIAEANRIARMNPNVQRLMR
jgi:hypothetical protein